VGNGDIMDILTDEQGVGVFFTKLLDNCKLIADCTTEIKNMMLKCCDEPSLEKKVKERGILLSKQIPFNESCKYGSVLSSETKVVVQQIKEILASVAAMDLEITALMKKRIQDISADIEKIHDGKSFVGNLRNQAVSASSLIDVCG
jgi:hypothetical protein